MIIRDISTSGPILINRLLDELTTAGIPVETVSSYIAQGFIRIAYHDSATVQQRTTDTDAVVAAHSASTPIRDYAASHLANRRTFAKVLYTLDDGIRNNAATLANIRATLTSTLSVIATLPAAYTSHFDKMRTLHGVTADPSTLTLAQCAELEDTIRSWINTRLIFAQLASETLD